MIIIEILSVILKDKYLMFIIDKEGSILVHNDCLEILKYSMFVGFFFIL